MSTQRLENGQNAEVDTEEQLRGAGGQVRTGVASIVLGLTGLTIWIACICISRLPTVAIVCLMLVVAGVLLVAQAGLDDELIFGRTAADLIVAAISRYREIWSIFFLLLSMPNLQQREVKFLIRNYLSSKQNGDHDGTIEKVHQVACQLHGQPCQTKCAANQMRLRALCLQDGTSVPSHRNPKALPQQLVGSVNREANVSKPEFFSIFSARGESRMHVKDVSEIAIHTPPCEKEEEEQQGLAADVTPEAQALQQSEKELATERNWSSRLTKRNIRLKQESEAQGKTIKELQEKLSDLQAAAQQSNTECKEQQSIVGESSIANMEMCRGRPDIPRELKKQNSNLQGSILPSMEFTKSYQNLEDLKGSLKSLFGKSAHAQQRNIQLSVPKGCEGEAAQMIQSLKGDLEEKHTELTREREWTERTTKRNLRLKLEMKEFKSKEKRLGELEDVLKARDAELAQLKQLLEELQSKDNAGKSGSRLSWVSIGNWTRFGQASKTP